MKVGELHGYEIHYDPTSREFEARKEGETVFSAPTQDEVENHIKKLHKKGFQRFKAIYVESGYVAVGEVTSMIKGPSYYVSDIGVWFIWKDEHDHLQRRKLSLVSLFEATPKNLKLAEKLAKLHAKRKRIQEQVETLRRQFKDPITKENVYKLAGLEG